MSVVAEKSVIREIRHERVLELQLDINEVNSFTLEAFKELLDVLARYRDDGDVRALVLTSAASGYFSNGLDPHTFSGRAAAELDEALDAGSHASYGILSFPVPTVAVLEGHAMGYGAVLALFADYTFMADKGARFCFPEVNIGLGFPAFCSIILQDRVGFKVTRDLLWGGRGIKGAEAVELGIADECHPTEVVREKAIQRALELSKKSQAAVRSMKEGMQLRYRLMLDDVTSYDKLKGKEMLLTNDAKEGFASILEKRRPVFD